MTVQEHLVENVASYVQDKGWNYFPDYITAEDVTDEMRNIPCADLVNEETLAWLITLARYYEYNKAMFDFED